MLFMYLISVDIGQKLSRICLHYSKYELCRQEFIDNNIMCIDIYSHLNYSFLKICCTYTPQIYCSINKMFKQFMSKLNHINIHIFDADEWRRTS